MHKFKLKLSKNIHFFTLFRSQSPVVIQRTATFSTSRFAFRTESEGLDAIMSLLGEVYINKPLQWPFWRNKMSNVLPFSHRWKCCLTQNQTRSPRFIQNKQMWRVSPKTRVVCRRVLQSSPRPQMSVRIPRTALYKCGRVPRPPANRADLDFIKSTRRAWCPHTAPLEAALLLLLPHRQSKALSYYCSSVPALHLQLRNRTCPSSPLCCLIIASFRSVSISEMRTNTKDKLKQLTKGYTLMFILHCTIQNGKIQTGTNVLKVSLPTVLF